MTYRLGRGIGLTARMAAWQRVSSAIAVTALMAASAGSASALAQEPASPVQGQAPEQSGARFKSAVDVVSVVAVVRDRKGRFVPDLSQRDFLVVESGESRPIVGFKAETDGPIRVAL